MYIRLYIVCPSVAFPPHAGGDGDDAFLRPPPDVAGAFVCLPQVVHCAQFVGIRLYISQVSAAFGRLTHAGYAPHVDAFGGNAYIRRTPERLAVGWRHLRPRQHLPLLLDRKKA